MESTKNTGKVRLKDLSKPKNQERSSTYPAATRMSLIELRNACKHH